MNVLITGSDGLIGEGVSIAVLTACSVPLRPPGASWRRKYGRCFGLRVGVFRGGCLTPDHSAVALHGFLVHLADVVVEGCQYSVSGYSGKQVGDQIHSVDIIAAFEAFVHRARVPARSTF